MQLTKNKSDDSNFRDDGFPRNHLSESLHFQDKEMVLEAWRVN